MLYLASALISVTVAVYSMVGKNLLPRYMGSIGHSGSYSLLSPCFLWYPFRDQLKGEGEHLGRLDANSHGQDSNPEQADSSLSELTTSTFEYKEIFLFQQHVTY